jgi:hypothetical protein
MSDTRLKYLLKLQQLDIFMIYSCPVRTLNCSITGKGRQCIRHGMVLGIPLYPAWEEVIVPPPHFFDSLLLKLLPVCILPP